MSRKKTTTTAPPAKVILGDFVSLSRKLEPGTVHLAIADPPYNMGMDYDSYQDDRPRHEYLEWTEAWLAAAVRVLHKHGALWIFIPDEYVSEIDVLAKGTFKLYKRRHIIWGFGFGVACQKNFARSHCHLLYLTRTKTKYTFNDTAVRVPSDRQLVYNDTRANPKGKLPNATWLLTRQAIDAALDDQGDLWYVSRICGTFNERKKHSPNQIPVPIMERIILATSNPGELVLDPFAGTGSAGIAAVRHGRGYLGYDVSKTCVDQTTAAIQETAGARWSPSGGVES